MLDSACLCIGLKIPQPSKQKHLMQGMLFESAMKSCYRQNSMPLHIAILQLKPNILQNDNHGHAVYNSRVLKTKTGVLPGLWERHSAFKGIRLFGLKSDLSGVLTIWTRPRCITRPKDAFWNRVSLAIWNIYIPPGSKWTTCSNLQFGKLGKRLNLWTRRTRYHE